MSHTSHLSLYFSRAENPPPKTTLSSSPPAEPFRPGLDFGRTVNAITGEIRRPVINTHESFPSPAPTGVKEGEIFRFKQFSSARDVENSITLNFQSAITIPAQALDVSIERGFDFSNSSTMQAFSVFYLVQWENGTSQALPERPVLYNDAQTLLDKGNFSEFREFYGDYYVHQIISRSRFSALWRCTGETEAAIQQFKTDLNVGVCAPGDVEGTCSFETALKSSASNNDITLEVQVDTCGTADDVFFNTSAVFDTLQEFRKKAKLANDQVIYRHHSFLKEGFPMEIDIDPDIYVRLLELFSTANFVLFLNGLTPGTSTTRMRRREELVKIFKFINAKRTELELEDDLQRENAWEKIGPALDALSAIRVKLLALLDRQEIVLKVTNLTVEDIISLFQIDHKSRQGHWVNAVYGKWCFQFGETALNRIRYGVQQSEFSCGQAGSFLGEQCDALNFPTENVKGTVVGITVMPNRHDGTCGYWCIPTSNPLGKKQFKIEFKSESNRGMDWTLRVIYIPDSEYADMQFNRLAEQVTKESCSY